MAAMPRDIDTQKMRSREWAAYSLLVPVQSCASCSLQGGTWLSAAVVRSRDPCTRPTQLCPHGSAAAPPPALPAVHRLRCRQRGVGVAGLGWCLRGVLEIERGYWSPCRIGGSYIRLTSHVMMTAMMVMLNLLMLWMAGSSDISGSVTGDAYVGHSTALGRSQLTGLPCPRSSWIVHLAHIVCHLVGRSTCARSLGSARAG